MKYMRILQQGGVLGKGNEEWRNISEHCLTEAAGAAVLAEGLQADVEKVVASALLHDWYKRREIEAMNTEGAATGHRTTLEEDKAALRALGIPEEVIVIAHANIPDTADAEALDKRSLEEKIMHYMDAVTTNTQFTPYQERFALLEKKQRNVDFSNSYRPTYGGKSLYEVQVEVADREQREFEQALGIEAGKLLAYIAENLKKKIEGTA
jgi:HD superfamily phosphodiesterase